LFVKEPEDWAELRCPGLKGGTGFFSWDRFFRTADRWLKWYQKHPLRSLRRKGLEAAERWMIRRFDGSDGLGAIYPPMVWSIIALKCLGYPDDSPELRYCRRQLEGLVLDDEASPDGDIGDDVQGSLRIQPCKSPVWDTAIAVRVLAASGVGPGHPALAKANHWLLSKQIRRPGDWAETVRAEPGGWCFEYANDFYPDSDDTAMVLMALQSQFAAGPAEPESSPCDAALPQNALPQDAGEAAMRDNGLGQLGSTSRCNVPSPHLDATRLGRHPIDASQGSREASQAGDRAVSDHAVSDHTVAEQAAIDAMQNTVEAIDRGMRWMVAMQNRDGGWGAFDRNNDREFLCHVPFADHNAMIDPSTPDLTGRVLESLGRLGERVGKPEVDRAVAYLRREQMPDGSWFGRWGVNYVYGTWQTVVGLTAVGVPADDPAVAAGVQWLLDHQQACGAWGESPDTYEFPHLCGRGTPTASQTAWGMMGLMAAGLHHHPAVLRAVRYLLLTQKEDGAWDEKEFTGTGFPRVFYLRYHYYRIYFPLLALSQWLAATQANAMSPSPLSADLRETSTAKRG
jgi:squalene-hopene/tetraprenyl-beta-curcumene cyclase